MNQFFLQGSIIIGSSRGGVNIEEVAKTDPTAIVKAAINVKTGVTKEFALKVVLLSHSTGCPISLPGLHFMA